MSLGLLFSKFFKFILVEADGCIGRAVVDIAVIDVFAETPRKTAHYCSIFQKLLLNLETTN